MPRDTVIERYFDRGDLSAAGVLSGATDHQGATRQRRARARNMHHRSWRFLIGGGSCLRKIRLQAHVRKQIDGCLLDVLIRSVWIDAHPCRIGICQLRWYPGLGIVVRIQTPTPLDRARAEYQGSACVTIERQMVSRATRVINGAMVLNLGNVVDGVDSTRAHPSVETHSINVYPIVG